MPSPQLSLSLPAAAGPQVAPPATPRLPRTWYFTGTTVFGIGAFALQTAAQLVAFAILILVFHVGQVETAEQVEAVVTNGAWLSLSIIAGCPVALGALWIPVRMARRTYAAYLGLRWPTGGELGRGLAMLAAFLTTSFLLRLALHQPTPAFMIDTYKSARAGGALDIYIVGFCLAGPVAEEFLFRGFVLRGWPQSFLGPVGAVLLSSLVWASLHSQYNLFYMAQIFALGILLGTLRLRSASTWLTVVLHALNNLVAVAEVAWLIG